MDPVAGGKGLGVAGRARSFAHALRGLRELVSTEPNARIHLVATLGVGAAAALLGATGLEWALLALATGLVWLAEGMNTALEALCDRVAPEPHPLVRRAKDVAAAGVLCAAGAAAAVGLLVFVPKLLARMGGT